MWSHISAFPFFLPRHERHRRNHAQQHHADEMVEQHFPAQQRPALHNDIGNGSVDDNSDNSSGQQRVVRARVEVGGEGRGEGGNDEGGEEGHGVGSRQSGNSINRPSTFNWLRSSSLPYSARRRRFITVANDSVIDPTPKSGGFRAESLVTTARRGPIEPAKTV